MPLIKDGRFVSDDWQRFGADDNAPLSPARLLMSWEVFKERGEALAAAGHDLGIDISNDADPESLSPVFETAKLIAVQFPKAADGRGFSVATRLRRLGYVGELRTTGYLIADQYVLARSCGFDTVEISEALAQRQPEPQWIEAEHAMSLAYQRGYGELRNILSSRWAGAADS
jgi:uncharacterized protein (DUF934 family)